MKYRNLRRFSALLLILVLLILPVAGCQLIEQEAEAPGTTGETVLNLSNIDPYTLDPAVSSESTSHQYIVQIFGGLVRLDDDLEPAPDIAERWEISQDGLTYTFYLREDVRFHDGREVKARDFKYSWERACNPATGSQTAPSYLDDIVGVKDVLAGIREDISGVRVVDDYTLEVTIDAPKAYFLSKLTYRVSLVVDRANVEEGGEWWRKPNGTGAFRLKEWQEQERLVLERNEDYYGELAGVHSVVYHFLSGVSMNLYETGEIDVTGVSPLYIDRVTDRLGPFHDELEIFPELSFVYIGFNSGKPPFDDVNIRRAFSQAIDKEKMTSLIRRDMAQTAYGILPPGLPGYNEGLNGLSYDVERARQMIARSKYGDVSNLPPITITTTGWGGLISGTLEAIVHQWRENLGVEVMVRQLEPERLLYHFKEEIDNMYFFGGWVADYPHPQDFLEVLFYTDAENNYGGYSNPGADRLLDRARAEMDYEQSLSLYQQVEQMLVDDAACLPLWFGQNYILIKPYVQGYDFSPMGDVDLSNVRVDPH
jgi:oligopeptide transport system substrate-binding protein